ncbi:MAG: flavodoxin domain-containing protein, partial [Spirochaetales bacterium]|nr:flavodoxin domain-containing protein [Spirochaetales bacterium]
MNKIAIFYFSGTGNTKYAMDKLCNYLTELNCDTKAYSIEKITTDSANGIIKESDITIIGYPIYGSDLPDIMHDFINKLSPVSGKKLGVIATQLLFSGDGSSVEKKKLKKLGFN